MNKTKLPTFPTTDEEMEKFLKNIPPAELPEKYKTPDWIWENEKLNQDFEESIGTNERIANFLESLTLLKDRVHIRKKDLDIDTIKEWVIWLRNK